MDTYRSYKETSGQYQTAVAIGNFDGLHRGHRALLEASKHSARSNQLLWSVLTFSLIQLGARTRPRTSALMTIAEKTAAFRYLGLESLVSAFYEGVCES